MAKNDMEANNGEHQANSASSLRPIGKKIAATYSVWPSFPGVALPSAIVEDDSVLLQEHYCGWPKAESNGEKQADSRLRKSSEEDLEDFEALSREIAALRENFVAESNKLRQPLSIVIPDYDESLYYMVCPHLNYSEEVDITPEELEELDKDLAVIAKIKPEVKKAKKAKKKRTVDTQNLAMSKETFLSAESGPTLLRPRWNKQLTSMETLMQNLAVNQQ